MDSFEVIISPKALEQLDDYISYIQYTLLNSQAAVSVWQDAMETRERLSQCAGSLALCGHPELRRRGYRLMRFKRHSYVMLYRTDGNRAIVEAVYHQLQDYENTFSDGLDAE